MDILNTVASYRGVSVEQIKGTSRKREIVFSRQLVHYAYKSTFPAQSLESIGALTGNDHSSVVHSIKTIKNLMETDKSTRRVVHELMSIIEQQIYGRKKIRERVISRHKVTYKCNGFTQEKSLISDEDYSHILKPLLMAVDAIEDDNKGKRNEQSTLIRNSITMMFGDTGEIMTTSSPLGMSLKSGEVELLPQQGGKRKVEWAKC